MSGSIQRKLGSLAFSGILSALALHACVIQIGPGTGETNDPSGSNGGGSAGG